MFLFVSGSDLCHGSLTWAFSLKHNFLSKKETKSHLISIMIKAWLFICQDPETKTSVKSFSQVLFAQRRSVVWYVLELDLNYSSLSNDGLSTLSNLIFYNLHCSQGYIMERKWRKLRACFLSLSQLCDNPYSVPSGYDGVFYINNIIALPVTQHAWQHVNSSMH